MKSIQEQIDELGEVFEDSESDMFDHMRVEYILDRINLLSNLREPPPVWYCRE